MVNSMSDFLYFIVGIFGGFALAYNMFSQTKERAEHHRELSRKIKEIELLEEKLAKCQKWSKVIAEENAEFRRKK